MMKTASFAVMHFTVASGVTYLLTGSMLIGSAVARIEPAVNTIAFYFHEKAWQKYGHSDRNHAAQRLSMATQR